MSFGWSAGDLATAVALLYNLIQALDSCDGAASDYREAVGFLQDLKRTLEPLQAFSAWGVYPTYGKYIEEQVTQIKEPIGAFLAAVIKFEPSLGENATPGHYRHVLRKLQWHYKMSKKVLELKGRILSHMRIIDTLLQRLTLDVVLSVKTQLPQELRVAFEDTLRPELISLLRDNLHPLSDNLLINFKDVQKSHYEKLASKLSEHYNSLATDIQWLKEYIDRPCLIQDEINYSLPGSYPIRRSLASHVSSSASVNDDFLDDHEDLRDLYYWVFLYIGYFLKTLFLSLYRLMQPSQALVPRLLAKYNISFLDAIGRAPRILPYEIFQTMDVLQAFIRQEFRYLPGASWVNRGDYLLLSSLSSATNRPLTSANWNNFIAPGTTVTMSMIIRKLVESASTRRMSQCPQPGCTGTWTWSPTLLFVTCPMCQKEVLTTLDYVEPTHVDGINMRPEIDLRRNFHTREALESYGSYSRPSALSTPPTEDDIVFFKRIAQAVQVRDVPQQEEHKVETALSADQQSSVGPLVSSSASEPSPATTSASHDPSQIVTDGIIEKNYDLPCEFLFLGCTLIFQPDDREAWILHSMSHFSPRPPPPKSLCIFCDGPAFENSQYPAVSWERRMIHIADHYGDGFRFGDMRLDYFLIDYMGEQGLIDHEVYNSLSESSEIPYDHNLTPLGQVLDLKDKEDPGLAISYLHLSKFDQGSRGRERDAKKKRSRKGLKREPE